MPLRASDMARLRSSPDRAAGLRPDTSAMVLTNDWRMRVNALSASFMGAGTPKHL
jgi:hypothetical protein